jgi:hypothetical protein
MNRINDNYIVRIHLISSLFIFIFIFAQPLYSQLQIELPIEIKLKINDSEVPVSSDWRDSLHADASAGKIYYKIVGATRSENYVLTQVQIPQILNVSEVLRQIVIYYALLPSENIRVKEILNIFPYFKPTKDNPAFKIRYISEGEFHIEFDKWETIPLPDQPLPEEKDIYNQIIQSSFSDLQSLGDVPDRVLEKIAIKYNLSVERIKTIYQNTILWQIGSQIQTK